MISCSEAVRRLWEYFDDELDAVARGRVDEHLAFCRRCCGEAEFAQELRNMLRTAARPDMPGDVEQRLEGCLRELEDGAVADREEAT